MAHFATPILVVSPSMNRGAFFETYIPVAGAVESFEKASAAEVAS